jgi:anti-sigma regulatory factor (Ser/Thr protein kinase)
MRGSRGPGDSPGPVDGDAAVKATREGELGRDSEFVLREPAVSATVRVAPSAMRSFADRHGASEAVQTAVGLAVTEACASVVVHAYVDAYTVGHLELRAHVRGDELIVQVSDEGRGMQPGVDSPGSGWAFR